MWYRCAGATMIYSKAMDEGLLKILWKPDTASVIYMWSVSGYVDWSSGYERGVSTTNRNFAGEWARWNGPSCKSRAAASGITGYLTDPEVFEVRKEKLRKHLRSGAFSDRSDINTDEIIPAKYLTEVKKSVSRICSLKTRWV